MLVAGRTPPSISWWQTRAGWQSLVKTASAGGGGRRPVFTKDCHPATLGHRGRRSNAHRTRSLSDNSLEHASLGGQKTPRTPGVRDNKVIVVRVSYCKTTIRQVALFSLLDDCPIW